MRKFLNYSTSDYDIIFNANLKDYSTIKVGGKAKVLIKARSLFILINAINHCIKNHIKYKIIGLGANLIFSDNDYHGIILVNMCSKIKFIKNSVLVESGTILSNLISSSTSHSLSGLEYFSGIPATIGGATVNNLGAWNTEISNYVEYVDCFHISNLNRKIRIPIDKCQFGYRDSIFKNNEYIITKIKLNLIKSDKVAILKNIQTSLLKKISSQPLSQPSAGSIFKRNEDIIPAKLIDDAGLKGLKIGGAMVSSKHAGFIVNIGSCTSENIKTLIKLIQDICYEKYKVSLSTEVEFVD